MATLDNELQPLKARGRTSVTELGMATLSNELQPSKELASISVTEWGMATLPMTSIHGMHPILSQSQS